MRKLVGFVAIAVISLTLAGCGAKEDKKTIDIKTPDGKGVKVEVK
jgi:hypothetical protein